MRTHELDGFHPRITATYLRKGKCRPRSRQATCVFGEVPHWTQHSGPEQVAQIKHALWGTHSGCPALCSCVVPCFRHPFLDPDSRLVGHPRADVIWAPLRHKPRRFIRFAMQAEIGMTCVGLLGPETREVHAGFGEWRGHFGHWDLPLRGRAQNGREHRERLRFRIRCAGQNKNMRITSWGFHLMKSLRIELQP